ncbi:predicted transcriptional regulator YdeE [Bacillus oleivorans]|uniref:Predicted transcriptional regulator YdeE n=1 Tax=Bacillus oleivorans TaxID=1448271 RepID=A0A285D7P0_9BACI|nr:GyrI-like domain-containing protein [Bacillus oleivorans]SNX75822.1 predicted transcriptional regulator YdeE [Bacillus oleivorans]
MEIKVEPRNAFNGIGVKWSGTYEQAAKGEIRTIQQEFRNRIDQIKNLVNPNIITGLSYHNDANGFTYYLIAEAESLDFIPEGMEGISVPSYTFVTSSYQGEQVHEAYSYLHRWIEQNGFTLNQDELFYLEEYPVKYNPLTDPPRLKIHIPVKEKE